MTARVRLLILLMVFTVVMLCWGGAILLNRQAYPRHALYGVETYKRPDELQAQDVRERGKGLALRKFFHGNPAVRAVALTFDDGPHPLFTPRLLAVLAKYQVKATFFVVGECVQRHPELLLAELAGGHTIGNHTYHHVNLTRIPPELIYMEWLNCNNIITATTGNTATLCRPPGGDYDTEVLAAAEACHLTTVLWTDDPSDYARPGQIIIKQRVLDKVKNGGVILLHDGVQQTIDVLPQIIENLQAHGFQFQTVDEMMRTAGIHP